MLNEYIQLQLNNVGTRWKLNIEYDGTNYHGWQTQLNGLSVQDFLHKALIKLNKSPIKVYAAGRTDAGVHAKSQVVHFDLKLNINSFNLCRALNTFLKDTTIRIIEAKKVDNNFNARSNAILRYYCYHVLNRKIDSPLRKNKVWHIPYNLNLDVLNSATKLLEGSHNFSAFRATGCQSKSPTRTINFIRWKKVDDELRLYVVSKSFLYQQIRIICGSLIDCARGKLTIEIFAKALKTGNRALAGITAPPYGLYFLGVDYENDMAKLVPSWVRDNKKNH